VRSMGEPHFVDGRPVALIGLFQDITERHSRERSLQLTADTDMLTGLPNRACFEKQLAETVAKAQAGNEPACLLILDLDGFKGVNDTFGHAAGDDTLRVMADRLQRLAYRDFAARLGGDEFVMLVTRPRDCARIEDVIGRVLASLRHSVERDGQCRTVSATVGVALLDATIASPTELMRRADLALYEAKRAQRGSARIFGSDQILLPPDPLRRAA
jgi:diguanylate cyclase (GGDEF)-like protein